MMSDNPLRLDDEEDDLPLEVTVKGNCPRPWSDHLYFKLFLDVEGRNSTLLVIKCDVTCINVFTDVEVTLYKSRFIGGKQDKIAETFVFDLMKSNWEEKIPRLQVIELTIDIVMSSSPNYNCAEALLKLVQLEKKYLKNLKFDGKLNVQLRFAHSLDWDVPDVAARENVRRGLQSLYKEGILLEVMDKDAIIEEMKVDRIRVNNQTTANDLIKQRLSWNPANSESESSKSQHRKLGNPREGEETVLNSSYASSAESEEDFDVVMEHDMYHISVLLKLDHILCGQE